MQPFTISFLPANPTIIPNGSDRNRDNIPNELNTWSSAYKRSLVLETKAKPVKTIGKIPSRIIIASVLNILAKLY